MTRSISHVNVNKTLKLYAAGNVRKLRNYERTKLKIINVKFHLQLNEAYIYNNLLTRYYNDKIVYVAVH